MCIVTIAVGIYPSMNPIGHNSSGLSVGEGYGVSRSPVQLTQLRLK